MTQTTHPSKETVRDYMEARTHNESPPPAPDAFRRQLGWHLIPENGSVPEVPE